MNARWIASQAKALHPTIVAHRRHLHVHPELSFEEHNTARYVGQCLDRLGISWKIEANTGVVATINGAKEGPCVALRADLDALPIQEENECDYASSVAGVMHACGHDVHTASLLGAAAILNDCRKDWGGQLRLVFQPAEEKLPGGASLMIESGVLKNPQPSAMLAQHVFPDLEAGKVGFRGGAYMASTDEVYITLTGKGGHAALPHATVDTVMLAANCLVMLQQVVSRHCPPQVPCVLSFGRIEGLGATNVIPKEVSIAGTFRTLNEDWRRQAHQLIAGWVQKMADVAGAKALVRIEHGYPSLYNEPQLTQSCKVLATEYLGAENVVELDVRMTGEDFASYAQQVPACFYRLGTAKKGEAGRLAVHTPTFDVDESSMEVGAGLMAWLAFSQLQPR